MSSQQQNTLKNPGVASPVPSSSLIRNKSSYQTDLESMAHPSQMRQYPQKQIPIVNNYQSYQNMSPDILLSHKYSSVFGNISAQSPAYQTPVPGSSVSPYAGIDLGNSQLGTYHQAPSHQFQNQLQIEASLLQRRSLPPQHHQYQSQQMQADTSFQQQDGPQPQMEVSLQQHRSRLQQLQRQQPQNEASLQQHNVRQPQQHQNQQPQNEASLQLHNGQQHQQSGQPQQHQNQQPQIDTSTQYHGRPPQQHQNQQPQNVASSQQYHGRPPQHHQNLQSQSDTPFQQYHGRLQQLQNQQLHIDVSSQQHGHPKQHQQNPQPHIDVDSREHDQHQNQQPQLDAFSQYHGRPHQQHNQLQIDASSQQHSQPQQHQNQQPQIETFLQQYHGRPQQQQNQQSQIDASSKQHGQLQNKQSQIDASSKQHGQLQNKQPQIETFLQQYYRRPQQHQNQQTQIDPSSQQQQQGRPKQLQNEQSQIGSSLQQQNGQHHQNQLSQIDASSQHRHQQPQIEASSQQLHALLPQQSSQETQSFQCQYKIVNSMQRSHRNVEHETRHRPYHILKQTLHSEEASFINKKFQIQKHPQRLQVKEQLQQQSISQQHIKQQPQPKKILQNPLRSASNMQQESSKLSFIQTNQQEITPSTTVVSSQQEITPSTTIFSSQQTSKKVKDEESTQVEDKALGDGVSQESKNNTSEKPCLGITKDKTSLGLINELAIFNKLSHEYKLMNEQGPAHKRTFSVILKLADEEYSASGDTIKKAQCAAAALALKDTKYPLPPPKSTRHTESTRKTTPTTELNTLAMKNGQSVIYKAIEPQQSPYYREIGADFSSHYNLRYNQYVNTSRDPFQRDKNTSYPEKPDILHSHRTFYVSLRVGNQEFVGDGPTRQEARNNAALTALRVLKNLPDQNEADTEEEQKNEKTKEPDSEKSGISLVHEIALRQNMSVNFEVIHEEGPPHMKHFITKCTVGNLVTEGDGNSKKTSKKKSAELMLDELKKLPGVVIPALTKSNTIIQSNKKKKHNLAKSELQQQKADLNYGVDINPISRLIQIMQARKKKEPVYTLVAEKGLPKREFVIQVEVENHTCTGTGHNKKLAKRCAADAMLEVLGYSKPRPQPIKSSMKHSMSIEGGQSGDKRVTFVESENTDKPASSPTPQIQHQRVPGLLHLPTNSFKSTLQSGASSTTNLQQKEPQVKLNSILKPNIRPEVEVDELCTNVNNELNISNFTKKHVEGITQITIEKESSSNVTDSPRDKVAEDALNVLLVRTTSVHICGDGPVIKENLFSRPVIKENLFSRPVIKENPLLRPRSSGKKDISE